MIVECPQCHVSRDVQRNPKPDTVCRKCTYKNHKTPLKKELFRTCNTCGDIKKVNTERESKNSMCRTCYDNHNVNNRTRICIDCGDVKVCDTKRDAQALRCMSCAAKAKIVIRKFKPKVQYFRYCAYCGDISVYRYANKTNKCVTCSRERKIIPKGYYDFDLMKYKLQDSGCVKEIKTKSTKGLKLRMSCVTKEVIAIKEAKNSDVKPKLKVKNKNTYRQVGTDGAKVNKVTVKFQTVDLDTLEEVDGSKKNKKEKEIPIISRKLELQMQEEWLKKNKVKEL